jgi:hypothetical protein
MVYPSEIKKWGEIWSYDKETNSGVLYRRLDKDRSIAGFIVFRKKFYKKDYSIGQNVIAKSGDPMIPGETAFGQWAWNFLKESELLANKKLELL